MQENLRARHRIMWIVIGVIVVVALTLAFYRRVPIPRTEVLPVPSTASADQGGP